MHRNGRIIHVCRTTGGPVTLRQEGYRQECSRPGLKFRSVSTAKAVNASLRSPRLMECRPWFCSAEVRTKPPFRMIRKTPEREGKINSTQSLAMTLSALYSAGTETVLWKTGASAWSEELCISCSALSFLICLRSG